jgi:hypothetical protein
MNTIDQSDDSAEAILPPPPPPPPPHAEFDSSTSSAALVATDDGSCDDDDHYASEAGDSFPEPAIASLSLSSSAAAAPPINVELVRALRALAANESLGLAASIFTANETLVAVRQRISSAARENFVLERELGDIDEKIKLLIQNRITAQEVRCRLAWSCSLVVNLSLSGCSIISILLSFAPFFAHPSPPMQVMNSASSLATVGAARPNALQPSAREQYERLFHLLQSEPRYLAALIRLCEAKHAASLVQTVVLDLFGDQYDVRQERLLLAVFERVLAAEFDECTNMGEFCRANSCTTQVCAGRATVLNCICVQKRAVLRKYLQGCLFGTPYCFYLSACGNVCSAPHHIEPDAIRVRAPRSRHDHSAQHARRAAAKDLRAALAQPRDQPAQGVPRARGRRGDAHRPALRPAGVRDRRAGRAAAGGRRDLRAATGAAARLLSHAAHAHY